MLQTGMTGQFRVQLQVRLEWFFSLHLELMTCPCVYLDSRPPSGVNDTHVINSKPKN
jgi:hypothetical protein